MGARPSQIAVAQFISSTLKMKMLFQEKPPPTQYHPETTALAWLDNWRGTLTALAPPVAVAWSANGYATPPKTRLHSRQAPLPSPLPGKCPQPLGFVSEPPEYLVQGSKKSFVCCWGCCYSDRTTAPPSTFCLSPWCIVRDETRIPPHSSHCLHHDFHAVGSGSALSCLVRLQPQPCHVNLLRAVRTDDM